MSNPLPAAPPGYQYVMGEDNRLYIQGSDGKLYYPQGTPAPAPTSPHPARMTMPDTPDMGGTQPGVPAWVPIPFYPTHPFQSTNPRTGHQTRYYGTGIINQPAGTEVLRTIPFDIPVRIIAINGAAFNLDAATGNAFPVGVTPRSCWLIRIVYSQGDNLTTVAGLASNIVGTAERPGQLGGYGWTGRNGTAMQVGITPLLPYLRIDVAFVCLELRGNTNHT